AEEKLSRSEERFRLLVEGAKEYAILMLNISGRIVSWNAGAERTYGYKAREIIGQHFRTLYPAEEARSGRPERDLQQAREKGEISFESWRQKQDGSDFWADTIITVVKERHHRLRGFALITRDITERKNAEKTIQVFARLHQVDRSILAANSSEAIARAALEGLGQLIPYKFATVTRFDLELGQTSFVAVKVSTGIAPELTSCMLDAPDYEDLEHLENGVVQSVTDVDQETRAPLGTVLPFEGLRSYMIVPLLSQATFIGSLNFGSNEAQFFTQEHLEIAKEVANQMALALRNADLFEKLSLAHQRLQMLNQKMLQAQEMERHHLARELHDEVGQALTALRIHLEEIEALAQNPFLSQRLSDSNAILERILNQIRNLSLDLRPLMLDDLGLVAALRWYASSRAQLAGFSIHFESDEKMEH
ncbi:MAG TPA: PAS domain S-box protein, partial [Acidobacteriota bacterium]